MSIVDRNDSKKAEKKSVYFNFGPDDSYFLRIGSQHRSLGRIGPEQPESWTSGKWQSFDCVAWTATFGFACRHGSNRINRIKNAPPPLKPWVRDRTHSPLRYVGGEESDSWFAWMLHGDHIAGPKTPPGMRDAANEGGKVYTSIRCAALGTSKSWLLIWEDGEVRANLQGQYKELEEKLSGLSGDDIIWAAINPFRAGDYFLYEVKNNVASFRVSETFGKELNDALKSAGITTKDITFSKKALVKRPKTILERLNGTEIEAAVEQTVGENMSGLTNAIVTVAQIGTALVGAVACTIM